MNSTLRWWIRLVESEDVISAIDALNAYEANGGEALMNMGTYVSEGIVGFLLPNGDCINIENGHDEVAEQAGTSLSALYQEGVARIYFTSDFLGIEIWLKPTPQQKATLLKCAKHKVTRFGIEGIVDVLIDHEDDGLFVTQQEVRNALEF